MKPELIEAMTSSAKQDWGTPTAFFNYVQDYLGYTFSLDACASEWNAKVTWYYTKEIDAFKQNPLGERIWMNPPYARGLQTKFVELAVKWGENNNVWCLIPARTDTKLFHELIMPNATQIIFIKGRLQHEHQIPVTNGSALMPQMLVQFRPFPHKLRISTIEPTPLQRGFHGN